jgi:hypothetical protein
VKEDPGKYYDFLKKESGISSKDGSLELQINKLKKEEDNNN